MNKMQEFMSSDDSEDDNYNYLTVLDNLNWNKCNDTKRKWFPNTDNNTSRKPKKTIVRNVSKESINNKRPAVAVQKKSNRNAFLINDLMASKNCKFTTTSSDLKNKTIPNEVINKNNKRVIDSNPEVIVIENNSYDRNVNKNNKNKKLRYSQTNYSVESVLASKRANHDLATEKCVKNKLLANTRNFGKAFSPTVHPVEIPVLLPSTSNSYKIKKFIPPKPQQNYIPLFEDNSNNKDSKYSAESILAIILEWKPQWLKECSPTEIPPLLSPFGEGIGLKTSYDSLEDYQSAYIPLILYETWAQIYEEYNQIQKHKKVFKAIVSAEYTANDRFIIISFQTTSSKHSFKSESYPSEGELIVVELNVEDNFNQNQKLMVFGVVTDFNCENIGPNTHVLPGVVLPQGPGLLLKYTIYICKRTLRLNSRESIQVRPAYYLKPTMRQVEVISALNSCPLSKDILKPRHFTCQVVVPTNISFNNKNFNESQNKAILGSAEALSRPYPIPKLLLIQGPPGTGKTHTLIGIIKQIYLTWDQNELPRILICAPSNGAVDEIARRLYSERRFMEKSKFKRSLRCVRVGQMTQIHPDVRKISLDNLIEDNAENEGKSVTNKINQKTTELEMKISKLDQEIANFRASGKKTELKNAENQMQSLLRELQRVGSNTKTVDVNKHRIKMDLMLKSDIVLSTLNSCHQSPIEMLFKTYGSNTFNCVIVDEASQCSEPELLMPLTYKMTKMILIGDPMQLSATVISKRANSLKLGRSLFERFYKYFSEYKGEQKSPILMLNEQYRMHPEICEFPSKHFYDGKLLSSEKVTQSRDFKIKPYTLFDITDTQESRNDPSNKYNELEANFVLKLVSIIDQIVHNNNTVGIITPYNGQKKFISAKIKDMKLSINVEVNTVDGFQGQERDVIILSCVRAFDNGNGNNVGFLKSIQRMNVALTRAKYSMILCISGRSLEINNDWRALIEDAMKRSNCRYKVPSTISNDKITKMIENDQFSK